MIEMFIIAGISSLLAAVIGALIALGMQRGSLDKIQRPATFKGVSKTI